MLIQHNNFTFQRHKNNLKLASATIKKLLYYKTVSFKAKVKEEAFSITQSHSDRGQGHFLR